MKFTVRWDRGLSGEERRAAWRKVDSLRRLCKPLDSIANHKVLEYMRTAPVTTKWLDELALHAMMLPSEILLRNFSTLSKIALWSLPFLGLLLSILEQSIGTRVSAAVVEMIMMMLTIQPSCLNMIPAIPETMVRGRNTQSIVNVEAITEIPTSEVP